MAPLHLLLLLFTVAASAAAAPSAASRSSATFIRSSCSATVYPSLCYVSLSNYSDAVGHDPVQLAWLAANVSLGRVRQVLSHVSTISRLVRDARAAAALRDCRETLGDAAGLTKRSAKELGRLGTAFGPEISWRLSNAQTWMSAAITNEDTCADGFQEVGRGRPVPAKVDVCRRVQRVKRYTSIALALVNHLVAGGRRK